MLLLRYATASQEVLLGPFLDDTDGKTAETGLTIANTDIKIWKAGATTEASKNSGGATHISAGRYYAVLDGTDTDTLGSGEINIAVSGALPVRREFIVLPAVVYDALVLGTDNLQVDAVQMSGTNLTARDIGASVLLSSGTGTGQIKISSGYVAPNWGDVGNPTTTVNLSGTTISTSQAVASVSGAVGSVTGNVGGNVTGSVGSVATGGITAASIATDAIDADALASDAVSEIQSGLATASALATVAGYVDTEVAAILADTNELQTDWANGGRLDLLIDAIKAVTDVLPDSAAIADAVWEELVADHSGTSGSTAEALAAAGGAGDPWITSLPGSYTSGQAGYILGTNLNATVSSRATQTAADAIETDTQDIQGRLPAALVSGRMASDAVAISGSTAAADTVETNIGNLDAAISSVSTYDGSDTSGTTTLLTLLTSTRAGYLDNLSGGAVALASGVSIAAGGITSSSFAAGAITAASIATDAIDADALAADAVTEIWSKAMSELSGVPTITGSVLEAVSWMFTASRNKITQTSTTQTLFKDDASTTLATSTVSDDGTTFTRGEYA